MVLLACVPAERMTGELVTGFLFLSTTPIQREWPGKELQSVVERCECSAGHCQLSLFEWFLFWFFAHTATQALWWKYWHLNQIRKHFAIYLHIWSIQKQMLLGKCANRSKLGWNTVCQFWLDATDFFTDSLKTTGVAATDQAGVICKSNSWNSGSNFYLSEQPFEIVDAQT